MHYFLQEEDEDLMNLDIPPMEDEAATEVVKEKKVEISNK